MMNNKPDPAPVATPPTLEMRPIEPIGNKIIDHPKLKQWESQGYASQEFDGLWLHYTAVCELLRGETAPVATPPIPGDVLGTCETLGFCDVFRWPHKKNHTCINWHWTPTAPVTAAKENVRPLPDAIEAHLLSHLPKNEAERAVFAVKAAIRDWTELKEQFDDRVAPVSAEPAPQPDVAEICRQKIYDLWKRTKAEFGQASTQKFVRENIQLAIDWHTSFAQSGAEPTAPTETHDSANCMDTHCTICREWDAASLRERVATLEKELNDEQEAHERIAEYLIPLITTTEGTSVDLAAGAAREIATLRKALGDKSI